MPLTNAVHRCFRPAVFSLGTAVAAMLSSRPELDPVKTVLFCRPAATLAALLTGGTLQSENGTIAVLTPGLRLLVPPGCSGFVFFLILTAALLLTGWNSRPKPARIAAVPVSAWLVTVLANAFRLIVVSRWEVRFGPLLPLPLPLQHQIVGMAVFLPTLLIVYVWTVHFFNPTEQNHDGKPAADPAA